MFQDNNSDNADDDNGGLDNINVHEENSAEVESLKAAKSTVLNLCRNLRKSADRF